MLYPVVQAYDSVALESDLTIIGSDQLFNEMLGRHYQSIRGQVQQVIITTKITPGIDGKEKQSKSLGNYIGLDHCPRDKFGRIMSIPYQLISQYLAVYTDVPEALVSESAEGVKSNPLLWKLLLAEEIVARYHGKEVAQEESTWFKKAFSFKKIPDDIPEVRLKVDPIDAFAIVKACLSSYGLTNSDIRRLFRQGSVRFDGERQQDWGRMIQLGTAGVDVKVGKRRWFKVVKQT